MKNFVKLLILSCLFICTSCVPSLNPLYTEQDLIFDSSLIGVWTEKGSGGSWALSSCENKLEYALTHTDEKGKKGEFIARLVRVRDKTFFDIVPVKPGFSQNDFYQGHYFSTHTFAHVVKTDAGVRLSVLETQWLKDFVVENPAAIRHQRIRDEIVLASTPKETQAFLLANLNTRDAFSEPIELARKREGR